jgi:uncharacterized protein YbjT (DUF2867 family)
MVDLLFMNILILGATGFIGFAVARKLLADGHIVSGFGRNLEISRRREPGILWIDGDLRDFTAPSSWQTLLDGVDAVVNCAGSLQDTMRDNVRAVQERAMLALYEEARAISRILIVQISAPRRLASSSTTFMETKLAADNALAASGINHVILRPALVLGRNAHGGSALLRALAAFPLLTPLAYPDARVQTVSLEELVNTVAGAVAGKIANGSDIELAGPAIPLEMLVGAHRRWLGLAPVQTVRIPTFIARGMSGCADIAGWFGWRSPMRSTAMMIARGGILANDATLGAKLEPLPPDMGNNPAGAQDVWFARLYLLKPLVIITLAAFWIVSGLVPLFDPDRAALGFAGFFNPAMAFGLTIATSFADLLLGFLVLFKSHSRKAMLAMLLVSLSYLAGATLIQPSLWLDPLGPLVKVFPSLVLTLAALAILEER